MNCGYVRKFPEVFFWLGIRRDKGASCLQLNPERFYILRGKMGQERDKGRERGKARPRQRKTEKTRVRERERKERKNEAKY